MITYSEFIRIRRLEQEDGRMLTKLTNETLDEMKDYIAINKKSLEEARKMDDPKRVDEISTQIKNAINTMDQIITMRMNKLANMAILGTKIDQARNNMTSEEIVLFDEMVRLVMEHKNKIITEMKNVQAKELRVEEEDSDIDKMVIKIIADVPKFIWRNNKSYGPFNFPNVVEIDKDVAEILIKGGKAVSA
jgi:DNA replication initiation complex subunit (GINS family)